MAASASNGGVMANSQAGGSIAKRQYENNNNQRNASMASVNKAAIGVQHRIKEAPRAGVSAIA